MERDEQIPQKGVIHMKKFLVLALLAVTIPLGMSGIAAAESTTTPQQDPAYCDGPYSYENAGYGCHGGRNGYYRGYHRGPGHGYGGCHW